MTHDHLHLAMHQRATQTEDRPVNPYPRRRWDPAQIDADIRNGTHARKTRAHHQAVAEWWDQTRPPIGRMSPTFPRTQHEQAAA